MNSQSTRPVRDTPNHTALWLGIAGLIPFVIPLLAMTNARFSGAGVQSAAVIGLYAPYVFVGYSAIILSFLSGTTWHRGSRLASQALGNTALAVSNVLALSAWASLLMIHISALMTTFAVTLLLCGYGSLLLMERTLESIDSNASYWRMRLLLTTLVAIAHAMVLAMLIESL